MVCNDGVHRLHIQFRSIHNSRQFFWGKMMKIYEAPAVIWRYGHVVEDVNNNFVIS